MSRTKPSRRASSPDAPAPTFSADDLLGSLAALLSERGNAAGMTSEEITDAKGWSRERVRLALRKAQKAGRLGVGRAYRPALDGSMRPVPVYTIRG